MPAITLDPREGDLGDFADLVPPPELTPGKPDLIGGEADLPAYQLYASGELEEVPRALPTERGAETVVRPDIPNPFEDLIPQNKRLPAVAFKPADQVGIFEDLVPRPETESEEVLEEGTLAEDLYYKHPLSGMPGPKRGGEAESIFGSLSKTGPLTAAHKLADIWESPGQLAPFLAGAEEAASISKALLASWRIKSAGDAGRPLDPKDVELVKEFTKNLNRDTTFGYDVAATLAAAPSFMGEMASTGGLYTLGENLAYFGAKAVVKHFSKKAGVELLEAIQKRTARKMAGQVVEGSVAKSLGGKVVEAGIRTGGAIVGGALQTAPASAFRISADTVKNLMPDMAFGENELGQLTATLTKEGDGFGKALAKAFGNQAIEVISEHSGGVVNMVPGAQKLELIKAAVMKRWFKMNTGATAGTFTKLLNRAGWNGVLGEIIEERFAGVARSAGKLQPWSEAVPTLKQLGTEIVAFGLMGSAVSGTRAVLNRGGGPPDEGDAEDAEREAELDAELESEAGEEEKPEDEVKAEEKPEKNDWTSATEDEEEEEEEEPSVISPESKGDMPDFQSIKDEELDDLISETEKNIDQARSEGSDDVLTWQERLVDLRAEKDRRKTGVDNPAPEPSEEEEEEQEDDDDKPLVEPETPRGEAPQWFKDLPPADAEKIKKAKNVEYSTKGWEEKLKFLLEHGISKTPEEAEAYLANLIVHHQFHPIHGDLYFRWKTGAPSQEEQDAEQEEIRQSEITFLHETGKFKTREEAEAHHAALAANDPAKDPTFGNTYRWEYMAWKRSKEETPEPEPETPAAAEEEPETPTTEPAKPVLETRGQTSLAVTGTEDKFFQSDQLIAIQATAPEGHIAHDYVVAIQTPSELVIGKKNEQHADAIRRAGNENPDKFDEYQEALANPANRGFVRLTATKPTAKKKPAKAKAVLPPGVTVKRAKNFETEGKYDVTIDGKKFSMYRNPENGWWYDASVFGTIADGVLGYTKAEAIASLQQKAAEAKPAKPAKPTGTRAVAQRIVDAEERFIAFAMEQGELSREQAETVLAVYKKNKAIKIDPVGGQYTFTHGDFANRDVLRRAVGAEPIARGKRGFFGFRGSGRESETAIYTEGIGQPIFGPGRYMAFDAETAAIYGPDVQPEEITLNKPLEINSDADWRTLTRAAGIQYPKFWQTRDVAAALADAIPKLREYLKKNGYDGVVVKGTGRTANENLREAFGHNQVFKLTEGEPTPPAPAPAVEEEPLAPPRPDYTKVQPRRTSRNKKIAKAGNRAVNEAQKNFFKGKKHEWRHRLKFLLNRSVPKTKQTTSAMMAAEEHLADLVNSGTFEDTFGEEYQQYLETNPTPLKRKGFSFSLLYARGEQPPDIIDFIHDQGGMLPKSLADPRTHALYDGLNLKGIYQRLLTPGGESVDVMAQMCSDEGHIPKGKLGEERDVVTGMQEEIAKAQQMRKTISEELQRQRREEAAANRQAKREEKEAVRQAKKQAKFREKHPEQIWVQNLIPGDAVWINGERVVVVEYEMDLGVITLEGGKKYGRQTIEDNEVIFVERSEWIPREQDLEDTSFLPPEEGEGEAPPDNPPPLEPTLPEQVNSINKKFGKNKKGGKGGFIDADILREIGELGRRVYRRGMSYVDWAARMVGHLGEHVRKHLGSIWRQIKADEPKGGFAAKLEQTPYEEPDTFEFDRIEAKAKAQAEAEIAAMTQAPTELPPAPSAAPALAGLPSISDQIRQSQQDSLDQFLAVIDTGIYAERDLNIISRELVQNSVDAFAGYEPKEGRQLKEYIHDTEHVYVLTDNGKGMDAWQMLWKYLPPATSGKAIGAGGGFGFAKGVVLGRPKKWKTVSVAVDRNDGKTYQVTIEGTGEGWKKYSRDFLRDKIPHEKFQSDFRKLELNENLKLERYQVPDGTPTGTVYALEDDTFDFAASTDTKFRVLHKDFHTETNKATDAKMWFDALGFPGLDLGPPAVTGRPLVHTKDFTSEYAKADTSDYSIELIYNPNSPVQEQEYIMMHVLSNGSHQFSQKMWAGGKAVLPTEMVMDVISKHKAGDAKYPFTVDRSNVRDDVRDEMRTMFKDAVEKAKKAVRDTYKAGFQQGGFKTAAGHEVSNFFPEVSEQDILDIEAKAPVINKLVVALKELFPHTNKLLLEYLDEHLSDYGGLLRESIVRSRVGGLTTHPTVLGVNIFNPVKGRYESFVNPFHIASLTRRILDKGDSKATPEELVATLTVDASSHEITHNLIRDEGESLSRTFTFLKSKEAPEITKVVQNLMRELYREVDLEEQLEHLSRFADKLDGYDSGTEAKVFNSGKERKTWDSPSALTMPASGDKPGGRGRADEGVRLAGVGKARSPRRESRAPEGGPGEEGRGDGGGPARLTADLFGEEGGAPEKREIPKAESDLGSDLFGGRTPKAPAATTGGLSDVKAPRLQKGQRQGDITGGQEDLTLVGETARDFAAEKAAAEKAALEKEAAERAQAEQQGDLFNFDDEAARIRLRKKNEGGFVNPDVMNDVMDFGRKIYRQGMKFADWSAHMIRAFGKEIAGYLAPIWYAVRSEGDERGALGWTGFGRKGTTRRGPSGFSKFRKKLGKKIGTNIAGKRTQLDANTGDWNAIRQESFTDAQRAQNDLWKAARKKIRIDWAMGAFLEAGGDRTLLAEWAAKAKGKKFRRAVQDALKLTPEQIALANKAGQTFKILGNRAVRHGVMSPDNMRPNYVTHVWNVTRNWSGVGAGKIKDRFKYAKARTFDTFFEGDQQGWVPKTMGLSRLLPAYMTELNEVISNRHFVKANSDGVAPDGRPLMAPQGNGRQIEAFEYVVSPVKKFRRSVYDTEDEANAALEPGQTVTKRRASTTLVNPRGFAPLKVKDAAGNVMTVDTSDYENMNDPALSEWRYIVKDAAGNTVLLKGDMKVHPVLAKRIRAMYGQSGLRRYTSEPAEGLAVIPKVLISAADATQAAMKREMFGLLQTFHMVQEGWHAIGHKINPFATRWIGGTGFFGLPDMRKLTWGMTDGIRHGLMLLPESAKSAGYLEGLGGKSTIIGKLLKFGGPGGRMAAETFEDYQNWLFHQFIPALKYKTYVAMLKRNMGRYKHELKNGEVTLGDVKHLSAEQANAAYGHLNYALLDRNPSMQHLFQLIALAPDFLEARGRFAGQAFRGIANKSGREQLQAIVWLGAVQMTIAYTLAQTVGGEWDAYHPFEWTYKGRTYTLRSVPEDIARIVAYGESGGLFGAAAGARRAQFIRARINPLTEKGYQLVDRRNYRGEDIGFWDTLGEIAANFIPIMARAFPWIRNLTATGADYPVSPMEQFWGSMGLRIGRHSPITKVYEMVDDYRKANGLPKETVGAYPISKYRQLRYALEDGDQKRAYEEYLRLRAGGMDRESIERGFKQSMNNPFTSSREEDEKFERSLSPGDRELYRHAVERREEVVNRFDLVLQAGRAGD